MLIEVSNGEILDKYSILEIKLEKINDESKLKNVMNELDCLKSAFSTINNNEEIQKKYDELKVINLTLWDIEDKIRERENEKDFGEDFIKLARSVYVTNDKRAKVKYEINKLTGSQVFEEKSYEQYA